MPNEAEQEFDFGPAYKHSGWGDGIAWRVTGYKTVYDEEYEWSGIKYDDKEWVVAHMIGDDENHTLEVSELTPLEEDEYCGSCGQVGCGWH